MSPRCTQQHRTRSRGYAGQGHILVHLHHAARGTPGLQFAPGHLCNLSAHRATAGQARRCRLFPPRRVPAGAEALAVTVGRTRGPQVRGRSARQRAQLAQSPEAGACVTTRVAEGGQGMKWGWLRLDKTVAGSPGERWAAA